MSDMLMDALGKLRSNANAARGTKRPERKQELLISIGLAPQGPTTDDMHEQMMGDEGEMMEADAGIPGGPPPVNDDDDVMNRRRY